jgi:hypothetical protein
MDKGRVWVTKFLMGIDRAWVKKILMGMNMKIPPPVFLPYPLIILLNS